MNILRGNKMDDLEKYLQEQLKNPEFKNEYDALAPEFELYRVLLEARKERGFSQSELSKLSGVTQADISRIENGKRDPSLSVAQRLAIALGYTIAFIPIK